MIDRPSAIDPLVAEGPLVAADTLRPAPSLQRVLLLDEPGPMMADLASGDIRRYESGPPVSVPMVSDVFDLGRVQRLQIQVLQDPRPSSVAHTLVSLDVRSSGVVVDVRATPRSVLEIVASGSARSSVSGPLGGSPAVVVVIARTPTGIRIGARNAETMTSIDLDLDLDDASAATVTIGGPSTRVTGAIGRRRTIPVLIDLVHQPEPIDQLRRVVGVARRVAGAVRDRAS